MEPSLTPPLTVSEYVAAETEESPGSQLAVINNHVSAVAKKRELFKSTLLNTIVGSIKNGRGLSSGKAHWITLYSYFKALLQRALPPSRNLDNRAVGVECHFFIGLSAKEAVVKARKIVTKEFIACILFIIGRTFGLSYKP
jgi:hypothetical protein